MQWNGGMHAQTHTHNIHKHIYPNTVHVGQGFEDTFLWYCHVCVRVECRTWAWYQPLWALHESCALHNRERVAIIGISLSTNLTWFFALTFQRSIYWFPHAFIHSFNTFQRKIQLMLQRQPRTSNLPSHSFIAPHNPPFLCGKDIWHISQPSVQIIRVYLGEGTLTLEGLCERKQAPV